jgi:hypothetical protein
VATLAIAFGAFGIVRVYGGDAPEELTDLQRAGIAGIQAAHERGETQLWLMWGQNERDPRITQIVNAALNDVDALEAAALRTIRLFRTTAPTALVAQVFDATEARAAAARAAIEGILHPADTEAERQARLAAPIAPGTAYAPGGGGPAALRPAHRPPVTPPQAVPPPPAPAGPMPLSPQAQQDSQPVGEQPLQQPEPPK